MILPVIAIGWFQVASIMRLVRSSMLDQMDTEYIKLARLKGLPERKVIWPALKGIKDYVRWTILNLPIEKRCRGFC